MYFPIFIDLSEKEILVVGAGMIAARRIRTLCGFAGKITVCAPKIAEEIYSLSKDYPVFLKEEPFSEGLLAGKEFVLAATSDPKLNQTIAELCGRRGIPVNVCSEKELCDFYFPSVIQKGEIVIGINASGENHSLVKQTRIRLEEFLQRDEES